MGGGISCSQQELRENVSHRSASFRQRDWYNTGNVLWRETRRELFIYSSKICHSCDIPMLFAHVFRITEIIGPWEEPQPSASPDQSKTETVLAETSGSPEERERIYLTEERRWVLFHRGKMRRDSYRLPNHVSDDQANEHVPFLQSSERHKHTRVIQFYCALLAGIITAHLSCQSRCCRRPKIETLSFILMRV